MLPGGVTCERRLAARREVNVVGQLDGELVVGDRDLTARAWRAAGKLSVRLDDRPPFPAADLRVPATAG